MSGCDFLDILWVMNLPSSVGILFFRGGLFWDHSLELTMQAAGMTPSPRNGL